MLWSFFSLHEADLMQLMNNTKQKGKSPFSNWRDQRGYLIRPIRARTKQGKRKPSRPSRIDRASAHKSKQLNLSQVSFDGTFDERELSESIDLDSDDDSDSLPRVLYLTPISDI